MPEMMCQRHWDMLREEIKKQGLMSLVPETSEDEVIKMQRQLEEGLTIDTFEPLMGAAMIIQTNCMQMLFDMGANMTPYFLTEGPEDPVEGYGEKYEGRTWPKCALCYVNLAHEVSCGGCDLETVNGYDFFIEKAAEGQKQAWENMKL